MAENKKSVLLYCDIINTVEKLDDNTAGELFKHYLRYVNDLDPETENLLVEIAFEPIKQNLKRDLKKWEERAQKSRENGKKGGRPPEHKKPDGLINNLEEPKEPVKDNVTVIVKDKVKETLTNSIDSRKLKFSSTLEPYLETYGRSLLNDFYSYWTEPNKSKTKFKQELEKTWSLERRLSTWANNDKNFNYGKKQPRNISQERIDALKKW